MSSKPTKYWNGNLSNMGKITAKKFPILLQMNEIIKGANKKTKKPSIFNLQKKLEDINDYLPLFQKYELQPAEKNLVLSHSKTKIGFYKIPKNNPKLFYHNQHCSLSDRSHKKSSLILSDCCKYTPKYDYIRPKIITGPNWKCLTGRKKKKITIDLRNFYTNNSYQKSLQSKCLVNMNKTTQRGDIVDEKHIRLKNEKTFIPHHKNIDDRIQKYSLYINLSNINDKYFKYNLKNFLTTKNKKIKNRILTNKKLIIKRNKNEKILFRHHTCLGTVGSNDTKISKTFYKKNYYVTDFKKAISREKIQKLSSSAKKYDLPFSIPNYSFVEEKTITKTIYKSDTKKNTHKNNKNLEGYDYSITYDPDKYINRCNNNLNIKIPDFNLMPPREKKNNKLPVFMQNIHSRGCAYEITDKALKLNQYCDGKYLSPISTLYPKKSYNKIININTIRSNDFNKKDNDEYIENKKESLKDEIMNKNSFNELRDLFCVGALEHFDNYTYRSNQDKKEIKVGKTSIYEIK